MTNTRPRLFPYLCFPMGIALLAFTIGCGGGPHDDLSHDPAPHEAHGEAGGDWEVEVSDGAESDHNHEGHSHLHEAPHGGTLIALGDHFAHLEVVYDATGNRLTIYVLDGEVENPVRLKQETLDLQIQDPLEVAGTLTSLVIKQGDTATEAGESTDWSSITLTAVANPLTGETVGDTSEFSSGNTFLLGPITGFTATLNKISLLGTDFESIEIGYPEGNEE